MPSIGSNYILSETIERALKETLKKYDLDNLEISGKRIDSKTEMTPGEYECLSVITQAHPGDILKLIPEFERDAKFVCIEAFDKTEMLCTNQMMPQYIRNLCALINGFFLDVHNINPLAVTIAPITINLSLYKKVENSSFEDFIQFHKELCAKEILEEKKRMRDCIAFSKHNIRENKKLLRFLNNL